ncbi:hypothetical protein ASF49_02905 [Methylobacterium sp. Leaf104]|uniref:hypothetical protein n=1 Tax=Methylobacterium TaxID=407 RepID=UPI0006F95448|nr:MULTISPECIES: hypothetical protein [Methylobacterium]KQP43014.1 hypothetical protein ASF49_02905 [Methylobacterium sp. Leaf104]MCI9878622.1 hypothetical protein [Methylobacterium goesingense]
MRPGFLRAAGPLLGLVALLGAARAEELPSLGGARLSGVQVDVRPLIALGGGTPALELREDLLAALRTAFADRLGGRGPVLLVRIKGLSINPYAGGDGGRGRLGGGTQSDYLDGEALLVGRRGEILARHPQLSAVPASSGGAWYDPDSERRRLTAIAEHYAGWLRRALPAD